METYRIYCCGVFFCFFGLPFTQHNCFEMDLKVFPVWGCSEFSCSEYLHKLILGMVSLLNFSHSNRCAMVPHSTSSGIHFLNSWWCWASFVLFFPSTLSLIECFFKSFDHFFYMGSFYWVLRVFKSILRYKSFTRQWFANIFCHFVTCL